MLRPLPIFTVLVACCASLQSLALVLRGHLPLMALALLIGVGLARLLVWALPRREQRQGAASLLFLAASLVGLAPSPSVAQNPIDVLVLLVAVAALILLLEGPGPELSRRAAQMIRTAQGFRLTRPVMGESGD
ncbi:hypothetical protein Dxin01_00835 [Deinococcus xinjiangensis]|uniref:Uncharacterized protein n=1 Tax=Deinococcus xinjiangensis TaxID=457454 RepID=A0ABP9V760_9DEIO